MLKIRLKRAGRKRQPSYRVVLMNSRTKRDGYAIEELGFYNPITKKFKINDSGYNFPYYNGITCCFSWTT